MNNKTNQLDELFKNAFSEHTPPPRPQVWNNLSDQLFDGDVRAKFQDHQESPAPQIWGNISNQLFDSKVQSIMADMEVQPSKKVWDNIAATMFDESVKTTFTAFEPDPKPEVWNNIKKILPLNIFVRRQLHNMFKVAAVLLVGMLLALIVGETDSYNTVASWFNRKPATQPEQENVQVADNTTPLNTTTHTPANDNNTTAATASSIAATTNHTAVATIATTVKPKSSTVVSAHTAATSNGNNNSTYNNTTTSSTSELPQRNVLAAVTPVQPIHQNVINSQVEVLPALSKIPLFSDYNSPSTGFGGHKQDFELHIDMNNKVDEELGTEPSELRENKGIELSVHAQLGNSWIFNNQLRQAIATTTTNSYKVSLDKGFGIGLAYRFNQALSLQTGVTLSDFNQAYREVTPTGTYRSTSIHTNYLQVPVTLKLTSNVGMETAIPATLNFVVGAQYARLRNTSTKGGIELNNLEDYLVKNEVGFVGGIEYDITIAPKTYLSLAGMLNYGVDVSQPFTTQSANNFATNFNVGLHFQLNDKK